MLLLALGLSLAAAAPPQRCAELSGRKVCLEGPQARGLPLLIYLHGYSGEGADDALHLRGLAESARFLYAAPDAPENREGQREWQPRELAFLHDLIPRLVRAGSADPRRVYIAGFSLGGFRALDLACTQPKGIAAVVSVSGTRLEPTGLCTPGAVSTLQVHGEEDTVVAPAGGIGKRTGIPYLSARAAASLSAGAAGCKTPLTAVPGTSGMHVERASGCRGGAAVELWMVPGMDHRSGVPPSALWDFLRTHQ